MRRGLDLGYCGFLAGPALIGLAEEARGPPVALGLVAEMVGLMVLGASALQRLALAAALAARARPWSARFLRLSSAQLQFGHFGASAPASNS